MKSVCMLFALLLASTHLYIISSGDVDCTYNSGILLGFGGGVGENLIVASSIVLIIMLATVMIYGELDTFTRYGHMLVIIGGAVNVLDRLYLGQGVCDYIGIGANLISFNLADIVIFGGIILIFNGMIRR